VKLSKTSLIFIVVGVVLIAGISLGLIISQQADQHKNLESRVAQANQKLALIKTDDLAAQKVQLSRQIEEYNTRIGSSAGQLSAPDDNIDTTYFILQVAHMVNVDITKISSAGQSEGELLGTACNILPMSLEVWGDIQSIANFVNDLSQKFPTSIANKVDIKSSVQQPEPTPEPTDTPVPSPAPDTDPETEKITTANISLVIYDYKGE
jgi:Tfp pilus assembly protein PilO